MSNSQLDKSKPRMKDGTEVTLKLSSNAVGDSNKENKFPHKLLLTSQQAFLVFQHVFQTSSRRLQDIFTICLPKTSSRRVCKTSCNYVLKKSWKTKKCSTEDVLRMSSRRFQYVFTKTNVCWVICKAFHVNMLQVNPQLIWNYQRLNCIKQENQEDSGGRPLGPLLKTGLPLMKNILTPLSKSV